MLAASKLRPRAGGRSRVEADRPSCQNLLMFVQERADGAGVGSSVSASIAPHAPRPSIRSHIQRVGVPELISIPHAQAAQQQAQQEAATAVGQGQAPAISTHWRKSLKHRTGRIIARKCEVGHSVSGNDSPNELYEMTSGSAHDVTGESGSTRCQVQKLSARKFHVCPC
jgi:hypothetical protein